MFEPSYEENESNHLNQDKESCQSFYVELNLRNSKWLINCSYNSHKNNIGTHLDRISQSLDVFSSKYERFLLVGDFNVAVEETHMKSFCENYALTNLIRQPTCYKNPCYKNICYSSEP